MMKVVSSTIISAIPSTPSVNRAPHVGIHGVSIDACQPASVGLNDHQRPSDTRNSSTKNQNATGRAAGLSTPPSVAGELWTGTMTKITDPIYGIANNARNTDP